MRKKAITILSLAFTLAVLTPIVFSAFSFKGEDVIFEYRDEDKDPTGLSYVTFDYNDANMTDSYKYYFDSNTTISESKLPLPNLDNETHQFQGWYLDKQGTTKLNFATHNFVNGEVFYAKYKNTSLSSLTGAAINIYNGSPSSSPMFFSKYNTLDSMTITGKVDITYANGKTYNASDAGTNGTTKYYYPYEAKMRVMLDCDITINNGGTLQLSSILGFKSGNNYNGLITSENYVALDLNGYTITVKSGGNLNGYGIIYNSKKTGGIVVESGGTMVTIFCMADFKGGTNLVGSYQRAFMSFGSFACPYWFCETLFYAGATLKGETSLCAAAATGLSTSTTPTKYNTTATLIGSSTSSLIQLSTGYLIRKGMDFDYFLNRTVDYGNITAVADLLTSEYRVKYIFTKDLEGKLSELSVTGSTSSCTVSLNSLAMSLKIEASLLGTLTLSAEMIYGDFPIPPHMDIELYSTTLNFGMSIVVMPSANIFVDENSALYFKNSNPNSYRIYSRITVLDEIPKDYYYAKNGTRTAGSYFLSAQLINSTVPGQIDMQGQFQFDTSNVDTSNENKKYTIGGNIRLSSSALASLNSKKDYVSLKSRFFYPNFYGYSGGATSKHMFALAARYYFSPIISDNNVYFQLSGSNDILQGETFDTYNGLFSYNGSKYFMYYTDRSNTTTAWSLSLSNQNPPTETDQTNKYNNTLGNFVPVDSIGYAVDNNYGQHGMYITYNGENYCYVNGAYIKASPTTGVNTVGKITGISDGEKFQVSSSQSSVVNNEPLCLTALSYEYKTERWLWNV